MKWYARNVGDYQTATKDLSMLEHGAYNMLLDHYYATEEPIPAKPATIMRIFGVEKDRREYAAITRILRRFFAETPRGWVHKRADQEIAKAAVISERRAQAGKRGALITNRTRSAIADKTNCEAETAIAENAEVGKRVGKNQVTTTTTTEVQKQDQTPCPATPDAGSAIAEKPVEQKRGQAKVIAVAALDYLNGKAGKKFKAVDATLKFAIDRVLYDGATLADLCAVVDYQLKRVNEGKLDAMYVRPETVWNKTKFASYSGEIGAEPPKPAAPAAPKRVQVFRIEGGEERVVTEVYVYGTVTPETFGYEAYAKKCYTMFRGYIERGGNTTVIIDFDGARRTFKTNELGAS